MNQMTRMIFRLRMMIAVVKSIIDSLFTRIVPSFWLLWEQWMVCLAHIYAHNRCFMLIASLCYTCWDPCVMFILPIFVSVINCYFYAFFGLIFYVCIMKWFNYSICKKKSYDTIRKTTIQFFLTICWLWY